MLRQYNAVDIEIALRATDPAPAFPPARDRAAWARIRDQIGPVECAHIIAEAEAAAETPMPPLTATDYLTFKRTGERRYEEPYTRRRALLAALALAECLEYGGRFLDPLLNIAWAICEESSWVVPAHQTELADMQRPIIDLFSSMTGLQLAELDLLLGAELDPALGARIRHECDCRLFTPYLTRHDHRWLHASAARPASNWNAVCNGNTVGAAVHLLDDPARLAEMIARAARSLDDYLAGFDRDGGSTEGAGYWAFGFGDFVLLAHLVAARTGGAIDFLADPRARAIAAFPLRVMLSPGHFANFSDSEEVARFDTGMLGLLADRFGLPGLRALGAAQIARTGRRSRRDILPWRLRGLAWPVDGAADFTPARSDWFGEMMWMIARLDPADPDGLVLAAKGGHNAELHNHNDVGSFIVHYRGESLIADVGRGRYTRAYFDPQTRYLHFANRSRGHSVPMVHGREQLAGRDRAARLLSYRADPSVDLLALDLKAAYPREADIRTLVRTVALNREAPGGAVEVVDEIAFDGGAGSFDIPLIIFGTAYMEAGAVVIEGARGALRVFYDEDVVAARVEHEPAVDLAGGVAAVNRVVFSFKYPAGAGAIRLRIVPA